MTKFVAVVSAKGGVGKTIASINLSSALEWFRRDVIALDANLTNPDMGMLLGAELMDKTIHSALKGRHRISESIYLHPSGIKIIPGSISYIDARNNRPENIGDILIDLAGSSEIVIIDSKSGFCMNSKEVIKNVDYVLIVTTPDLCSVSNSLKMAGLAKEYNKKILGILINRAAGHESELDIRNIEEILKNRVIGIIPEDQNIKESINFKNPVVFSHPNSPSSIGFKKLASELIGEKYVEELEKKKEESLFNVCKKALGI